MFKYKLTHSSFGTKEVIPPLDWKTLDFQLVRDKEYHGITLEIALDLRFVLDGMELIKSVYNVEKFRGKILLDVFEYNENARRYEPFSSGRLDLKSYRNYSEKGTEVVKVSVIPNNSTTKFLNQDDIDINLQNLTTLNDLPITPYLRETENVFLHSRVIVKAYEALLVEDKQVITTTYENTLSQQSPNIYFGFDQIKQNDLNFFTLETGFGFEDVIINNYESDFIGSLDLEFRINSHVYVKETKFLADYDRVTLIYNLLIEKLNGARSVIELINETNYSVERIFQRQFDTGVKKYTLNVEVGDKVSIFANMYIGGTTGNPRLEYRFTLYKDSYIKAIAKTQTAATYATGVMIYEAINRICTAITGNDVSFYSEYFGRTDSQPLQYEKDGSGSLAGFFNGFQLRGFPLTEKPIFASLSKIFKGLNAIHNIGAGVETIFGKEILRFEPKEHFYQDKFIAHLGVVSNLEITLNMDRVYSKAEIGFDRWRNDNQDNQGLDEFNTKHTYVSPHGEIKNNYQAVSNLIAAGNNIESVRRNRYVEGSEKDDKTDDSLFIISLVRENSYYIAETNQKLAQSSGILSPETIYNIRYSPARNARKHANSLYLGLIENEKVKFNFGEGNYLVESRLENETYVVKENEDIPKTKQLYGLENYKFDVPITRQQRLVIQKYPYGKYSFQNCKGETKYGFILSVKLKVNGGLASFELIEA